MIVFSPWGPSELWLLLTPQPFGDVLVGIGLCELHLDMVTPVTQERGGVSAHRGGGRSIPQAANC